MNFSKIYAVAGAVRLVLKVMPRSQRLLPLPVSHHSMGLRLSSSSTEQSSTGAPDPAAFFRDDVQDLLHSLTGLDYQKVFRVQKLGQKISAPTYAFLTDQELKEAQEKAQQEAKCKLQMPPVMSERREEANVIDVDSAIQGYDSAKLVFTDITYGVHDRDRIIVVREPDGVLREAKPSERDRLNKIYFPRTNRKFYTEPMFEPENLSEILNASTYERILDRNCSQFEPDHPVYVRTAKAVYNHVDENAAYDVLWSTRHYGPMVFHLASEKRCDDLVVYYLSKSDVESVRNVVLLYSKISPESKTANYVREEEDSTDGIALLRQFIKEDSNKAAKLHAALESMVEKREAAKAFQDAIDKAHS